MKTDQKEYYYRYSEIRYVAGYDQWGDPVPGYNLAITLTEYEVARHTPKGVRIYLVPSMFSIDEHERPTRLILDKSHKKFACPTKEEALESFIARKKAQIRILRGKLEQAETALNMATSDNITVDNIEDEGVYVGWRKNLLKD
jgi:hypothetical protein